MKFLKRFFNTPEIPIQNYQEFWNWFSENEKKFFTIVKDRNNIQKLFFDILSDKLDQLHAGYFFACGMFDKNTAELIISAEGNIKNIIFVEELVATAPPLKKWRFTALKPQNNLNDINIQMGGFEFSPSKVSFISTINHNFPDEIAITLLHDDYSENNKQTISNGLFVFLEHYLGELKSATMIDEVRFENPKNITDDIIPIHKLNDYLIWREKEFIEKYDAVRHGTENDQYAILEAKLQSGNPLIAVINTDLLKWNAKASHSWILWIEIIFDKKPTSNEIYDEKYIILNQFEDDLLAQLKDFDGYLNLGRQTYEGKREIFFACKDFRKPAKIIPYMAQKYQHQLDITFDIFKDKYWTVMQQFAN
ncbi:DUF695 domain-containing protein [Flavobacterium branchiophilum]|uniref:Uncharacterized protein n=1 Tax=Flavobacterium branchiophilum (strain FL-15) TaxID=1034807 RepID=G2Z6V5_FLABF|nr:DUF695 domain-containing protein [Flavobacterium branchiophilum]CCB68949.1 Protein of unknown function [Flavobacterium branchiophilum FL-15]